ncbi:MAG: M13 family metallopeptidase [Acidobacteria bacterium]|nr:M13 family metallopeptidase [Acidobacteriota bacterium]MBV9476785.1 M13 family metallopeptidase [Acidobacteriota bacterium]
MKPLIPALALVLAVSCATAPKAPPVVEAPRPKPLLGEHGFDLTQIDRSVSPCDNFYDYATAGWRKTNPLPSTYSRFGRFEEVADRNRATLRSILEASAKETNAAPGSNTQKIGDFWSACMNETLIEQQGAGPIQPSLDRINAINSRTDVVAEVRREKLAGINSLFRFGAQNDFKNSQQIIAGIGQGGLGLPDRDYYLRDDGTFKTTRQQYAAHIAKMFALAGVSAAQAQTDADRVVSLETQLAQASMARVEQRNPENIYHITPVADLQTLAPQLDLPSLFTAAGLQDLRSVNVAQPDYFREVNRLLDEAPVETWKAYLRWKVIDDAAPLLSSPFVNEDFAFRGVTLSGQKEIQPRWQRCVRAADENIGEILGQEYVKRAFTPEAKAKMNALIDNLVSALREDIPTLTWMGPETKRAALEKLDAFRRRIGYPDKWIDYTNLQIGHDSYAQNVFAANTFAVRRASGRIGKPDDPNEWGFFTPSTVNAGYNPPQNNITFPAGILQPPFYDPNADDAYNYGGIGVVIGHEMTHGFDDQGAKFDPQGNLRNWWTDADLKNFQQRAACIANTYGAFPVEANINLQGKLVTGEAIADLGGATIALRAYEKSLQGHDRQVIDGFTPEQRFFLGFAQVWAQNMAPEEARRRALTDPHAPGPARVNLTVQNMPEFADAWNCPAGAKMTRPAGERCSIW